MRYIILLSSLALLAACSETEAPPPEVVSGTTDSFDGVPLHYEVRGQGEPTLVLIPGWTNSLAIWGEHPRSLADTHRTVVMELAGHGESGSDRARWTMDAFGEDVVAVTEALGLDEVVLVGFSMGAIAALEAAERMPDRVQGVVIVDMFNDEDRMMTAAAAGQIEETFRGVWGDTGFIRAFAFSPDAPDSLVQWTVDQMPDAPEEHWFAMLPYMTGWVETELEPTLRGLEVPVAALNSTRVPTDVEAMREMAPGFTLDTLVGLGHAGMLLRRTADFDARLLALVRGFDTKAD